MRNAYLSAALLLVPGGAVGGGSSSAAVSSGQASWCLLLGRGGPRGQPLSRGSRCVEPQRLHPGRGPVPQDPGHLSQVAVHPGCLLLGRHSRSTAAARPAISIPRWPRWSSRRRSIPGRHTGRRAFPDDARIRSELAKRGRSLTSVPRG